MELSSSLLEFPFVGTKIPGDGGHPWRLNKFVEYQHRAQNIAPPFFRTLKDLWSLSGDDLVMLCWFHSAVYSEVTAAYLLRENVEDYDLFWKSNKDKLVFGSARKHAKIMDLFPELCKSFERLTARRPAAWARGVCCDSNPEINGEKLFKALVSLPNVGRFAADTFLASFNAMSQSGLLDVRVQSKTVDWRHGNNFSSGLHNIFYDDERADELGASGAVRADELPKMERWADELFKEVLRQYPDQECRDFVTIMSKVCSFRNLFCGKRYAGYHHDRQLEQLNWYKDKVPERDKLWQELFFVRRKTYPKELLGEVGGWRGVRPERCKLWLRYGKTGAEDLPNQI